MALSGALGLGLVARDAHDAAAFCVAGVAQSHIHLRLTWQTWHNLTSTFALRGRCGTISHPPSFCVAGVAQTHLYHRFAWQAWHKLTSTIVLRGRHGTNSIYSRFAWQAWHKLTSTIATLSHIHTYMHAIFSHTFTHSLSPPPLSFLPSPSPLELLKLSIGRS